MIIYKMLFKVPSADIDADVWRIQGLIYCNKNVIRKLTRLVMINSRNKSKEEIQSN